MNCRAALRMISAERDGALSAPARSALEAHVAGCPGCRQAQAELAAAAMAWKAADSAVRAPDVEKAWHAIRREIRSGSQAHARSHNWWQSRSIWAGFSLTAAAAVAVAVWVRAPSGISPAGTPIESWAQYVEVDQSISAPVVFVDQDSGWIVVWASEAGTEKS